MESFPHVSAAMSGCLTGKPDGSPVLRSRFRTFDDDEVVDTSRQDEPWRPHLAQWCTYRDAAAGHGGRL